MTAMRQHEVTLGVAELHALIGNARRLHEHHVWMCARLIAGETRYHAHPLRRRLFTLVNAEALTEATLLIAARATPPISVDSIRRGDGAWVARVNYRQCGKRRSETARHIDLAAALMLSCLQAHRRARRQSTRSSRRIASSETKETIE